MSAELEAFRQSLGEFGVLWEKIVTDQATPLVVDFMKEIEDAHKTGSEVIGDQGFVERVGQILKSARDAANSKEEELHQLKSKIPAEHIAQAESEQAKAFERLGGLMDAIMLPLVTTHMAAIKRID